MAEIELDGSGSELEIALDELPPDATWERNRADDIVLATGPIVSIARGLAAIDAAGNGDGTVTHAEAARWIAAEHAEEGLLHGHVRVDSADVYEQLESEQVGRIDADTVGGHAYYDDTIPQADVDRYYGGDLIAYLDRVPGMVDGRGDAHWEPDPQARPNERASTAPR